jgi:hypothetical protein
MYVGLAIGIVAVLVIIGTAWFLLARRRVGKRYCPGCKRARVPGREVCPFCGASYQAGVVPTHFERPRGPSSASAPRLSCVQGPLSGQEFPIASSEFTIGRNPDNTWRLEGTLVSRHHALITLQDGQCLLYDRESTNGTYVNGRRVAQHPLQAGDQIQIGPHVFVFQVAGAAVSPRPLVQPAEQMPTPAPVAARDADFGDYEIVDAIGGGGMSTVYRGVSRWDSSTVAIKVFHQTDPYLKQKFDQEIEIGTSLSSTPHPHIAQVYGGGSSQGVF